MLKIALSGCNGRMGRAITELASQRGDMEIVAGFDAVPNRLSTYPVYADPFEYTGEMDVYVDFSTASALDHILEYCVPRGIPLLLATPRSIRLRKKSLFLRVQTCRWALPY